MMKFDSVSMSGTINLNVIAYVNIKTIIQTFYNIWKIVKSIN